MSTTQHLTHLAVAVALAGTMALPGLALAHGDRDWRDDRRGDWAYEGRHWREQGHRHGHGGHDGWYRDRRPVIVVERPVYGGPYVAAPAPRPVWGNSVSVILQSAW